jgi:hypothetical protein
MLIEHLAKPLFFPLLLGDAVTGVILFLLLILAIAGLIVSVQQKAQRPEKMKELGFIDEVQIGRYLAGLPHVDKANMRIHCAVTDNDLVFLSILEQELDKIPLNSINEIIVDTRVQITQRLTVTRMLTLT